MNSITSQSISIKESPIPIAVIDAKAKLIEYSQALPLFFEDAAKNLKTFDKDILDDLLNAIVEKLSPKDFFSRDVKIYTKKGKDRWIKLNVYPFFDKMQFYHISFIDVTKEKKQKELSEQGKRMARVGDWTFNLFDKSIHWCPITKEIHEFPEDYEIDLEIAINCAKEGVYRDNLLELVLECIETGKAYDIESIIVTATGKEKWARIIGTATQVNGKTIAISGVIQDIDEYKKQREEYDIFNERMRVAIDSTNIGIWDYDIANNNVFWDKNMFNIFDVEENNFDIDAALSHIHSDDRETVDKDIEESLKTLKPYNTEYRIFDKEGVIRHIKSAGKVFANNRGEPYRMIGVNTDITIKKNKDQKLQQLLVITEKQNQRLLNFAYIVSHNLRSSSSNIAMLASMLDCKLSKEEQEEFIGMIKVSSESLNQTISQLNEIVEIQATDISQLKPVFLKNSISKAIQSINGLVLSAKAKIDIEIDKNIAVLVVKAYLQSIFFNLLTNSIKYKSPKRQLHIKIKSKLVGDEVIISFADNGLGIDLKKHGAKIFGMNNTFHNNEDARGIGLFITKNQIEAMNGEISITSQVDKGTTFHLKFCVATKTKSK